jgi:hypothetical protein
MPQSNKWGPVYAAFQLTPSQRKERRRLHDLAVKRCWKGIVKATRNQAKEAARQKVEEGM